MRFIVFCLASLSLVAAHSQTTLPTPRNIQKLVDALRSSHPRLRTSKESVSIPWDAEFFKNVRNVTLSTVAHNSSRLSVDAYPGSVISRVSSTGPPIVK